MSRIVVQAVALGSLLLLGAENLRTADLQSRRNPALGARVAPGQLAKDLPDSWKDPAYWGLKKGEPIPSGPDCYVGSAGGKKWAFEICTKVTYL